MQIELGTPYAHDGGEGYDAGVLFHRQVGTKIQAFNIITSDLQDLSGKPELQGDDLVSGYWQFAELINAVADAQTNEDSRRVITIKTASLGI